MSDTKKKYDDLPLSNFPEGEDNWARMSDLSVSLLNVAKQYSDLYNNGNIDSANALLKQYPDLAAALFTPERWNQLRDGIIGLQRFFLSDVADMIKETAQSAIGINDNATGADANVNAYSVAKVNELLNATNTAVSRLSNTITIDIRAGGWTQSGSCYTASVAIPNVSETDKPLYAAYIPEKATAAAAKAINKAFGYITFADTFDGGMLFTCLEKKPTIDMQISLKGVK